MARTKRKKNRPLSRATGRFHAYHYKVLNPDGDQLVVCPEWRANTMFAGLLLILMALVILGCAAQLHSFAETFPSMQPDSLGIFVGAIFVCGIALLLFSLFFCGYHKQFIIDRKTRQATEVLLWFSIPFGRSTADNLGGERELIELQRRVITSRRNFVKAEYEFFCVTVESFTGAIKLVKSKDFSYTRRFAEDIAGFLRFGLCDSTFETANIRPAHELDQSLRQRFKRVRENKVTWPRPELTPCCISKQTIDGASYIRLLLKPQVYESAISFFLFGCLSAGLYGTYWLYNNDPGDVGFAELIANPLILCGIVIVALYAFAYLWVGTVMMRTFDISISQSKLIEVTHFPLGLLRRRIIINLDEVEEMRCSNTNMLLISDNQVFDCLSGRSQEEIDYLRDLIQFTLIHGTNKAKIDE